MLYVKLSKCVFCAEEFPCLGNLISRNGVRIDPDKVQTIRDWPVPRTQEQLHSFPGLTGYVQRFCEQYAELTAPLFTLLKRKNQRNSKITLSAVQLKNFKDLKRRLSNTPVLYLPDFTQQMHMRTDASQYAVGGVLFQVVNGAERPIAYTSRKTKPAELKYPTQQQELLAIVNTLAAFRVYCLDRPVTESKQTASRSKEFSAEDGKSTTRSVYQPVFAYLPGTKNGIADALRRRPDMKPETKAFHDLLVPSYNETSYQLRIVEIRSSSDTIKAVIAGYTKDKIIRDIRYAIKKHEEPTRTRGVTAKQYKPYFKEKNWIWYQGSTDEKPRIVVPNVIALIHRIIAEGHDSNYGGHTGTGRTYLRLRADWYWPRMVRTIKKYVTDSEDCRRNKPRLTKTPGLEEPLQIPDEQWRSISMDFIADLPNTKRGHNSIWVVIDRLTKRSHVIATTKKVSAP
ncbi:Retrovirus Polyprotein [Phytophthora palmivora]|uniref:Retrovirus Polyprotein n=1 Tax=Phytophthora palmivora TaxID=4796 RepID=A0A2P4YVZ0_9STRA|nr:Retrovirus Polyprotein [Phytophthora palmivora]